MRVFGDLSLLDKLLPLLILLAMVVGTLLSVYVPASRTALDAALVVNVSVPLAVGLVVMLVPPFCKVEWENAGRYFHQKQYVREIVLSLVLNWVVCPFFMFGLAWLSLFDEPEYREGIILIGLARCIAMVVVWNDIAGGDTTLCAIIVVLNSALQIVLYAPYQMLFCYKIVGASGAAPSYNVVAQSVGFFTGIPFALGILIRFAGIKIFKQKYTTHILPFIGPWALVGLVYTLVVIFMKEGHSLIQDIGSAFRCFVPLTVYFVVTWFTTFFLIRASHYRVQPSCGCEDEKLLHPGKSTFGCRANYASTVTQSFTAASNNFELSLAVAISIYGSGSKQAIAATFGPLLEVPILLLLVFVARFLKMRLLWADVQTQVCTDTESLTELSE